MVQTLYVRNIVTLRVTEKIPLGLAKVLSNMPNFPVFLLNFPLLFFSGGSAQTHFHYVPYIEFMTSQMSFMSRYLWTHPLMSTIEI